MARVLIVDDDRGFLDVLQKLLTSQGYEVAVADTGEAALAALGSGPFDLVVSDIRMQPMSGIELLTAVRERHPDVPTILMTAYGTVSTALDALKMGAFDYVTKPFRIDEFLATMQRALSARTPSKSVAEYLRELDASYRLGQVVAASPNMQQACRMVERVAPTDATILLCGENGTGRRRLARAAHEGSQRSAEPCVVVDCAALGADACAAALFGGPQARSLGFGDAGAFVAAAKGTLVLADVDAMDAPLQERLLEVLQTREVAVAGRRQPMTARLVATAGPQFEAASAAGSFREDLYRRLSLVSLAIQPLRERREEIMPLSWHFVRAAAGSNGAIPELTADTRGALRHYVWPGNVAELEAVIRHGVAHAQDGRVTRDRLPADMLQALSDDPEAPTQTIDPRSQRGRHLRDFLKQREDVLRNEFMKRGTAR